MTVEEVSQIDAVGLVLAYTVVGVLFWTFVDQLPRDVYWFCLLEMNLSDKLVYLVIVLILPPCCMTSFRLRFVAAKYGSVLYSLALACLLIRQADKAEVNLIVSCIGLAALLMAKFSLWSFVANISPLSADKSCSLVTFSASGIALGQLMVQWLRWGGKSLNPLVPGNANVLVSALVCWVPIFGVCCWLFHRRTLFALDEAKSQHGKRSKIHLVLGLFGLPMLLFVTQWLFSFPTTISRWIGASTAWSWLILLANSAGAIVAQAFSGPTTSCLLALGLLLFGLFPQAILSNPSMELQLVGAAVMVFTVPTLWMDLPSAVFQLLTTQRSLAEANPSAVASEIDLCNELSNDDNTITDKPSIAPPSSPGSMLCGTVFFVLLLYIIAVALTIVLTCYDYLPEEMRSLRGQRYPLLPFQWRSIHSIRLWTCAILTVAVVCPVAVLRLGVYETPGSIDPPPSVHGITSDIRIFSFNVYQGFNRAGLNNFEPILHAIQDFNPHVIALQESDSMQSGSGANDFTDFLAVSLGMYSYAVPRTDQDSFGCSLLSTFPIDLSRTLGTILPSPNGENACMQHVTLQVNSNSTLAVVNVHLGNDLMAEKQLQLDAIVAKVLSIGNGTSPLVLVGDFNTRKYTDQYANFVAKSSLTDAGESTKCHASYNNSGGPPIEYIFFRGVTCIQFDFPHTYSQYETADSYPRIGHFNFTRE
ncbi:unnamed protein product [Aphanomyces euteiches]